MELSGLVFRPRASRISTW